MIRLVFSMPYWRFFVCVGVLISSISPLNAQKTPFLELTPRWSDGKTSSKPKLGTLLISQKEMQFSGLGLSLRHSFLSWFNVGLGGFMKKQMPSDKFTLEEISADAQLLVFTRSVLSPFLHVGATQHLNASGQTPKTIPFAGWGIKLKLQPSLVLVGKAQIRYLPDATNSAQKGVYQNYYAVGLQFHFSKKALDQRNLEKKSVAILDREIPSVAQMNEQVSFRLRLAPEDSLAVVNWKFSDGQTFSGQEAVLTFAETGKVRATMEIIHKKRKFSETFMVEVIEPIPACIPPIITAIQVPAHIIEGEKTAFFAKGNGTDPLQFHWEFPSFTASNASNVMARLPSGFQTLRVTVESECGKTIRSTRVFVTRNQICKTIRHIPAIQFSSGNVELSAKAQLALEGALDQLLLCPSVCLAIKGFGDGNEPTAQRAGQRARQTANFLNARGIAPSRIQATLGADKPESGCVNKPNAQCRRVEIVSTPCE